MMTDDMTEALAGLIQALRNEHDGMRFYRKAEETVQDARGKAMYHTLIDDEKQHMRILRTKYDRLGKSGGWVPLAEARKAEVSDLVLFPDETATALIFTPGMSDLDAMKLALDFERKGYEMYDAAGKKSNSPAAQEVFRFLAQEESRHFALLQKSYDYLASNGIWYFDDVQAPQLD